MTAVLGVAVLTPFASSASAFSFNENFGSENPDRYNTTAPVSAFNVTSGNVDLIGNGGGYDFYAGNGNYIDLNGNTSGTITSSNVFTFNPGESATLSFDYGKNGSGSADVFLGSNLIAQLNNPSGSIFTPFSLTFNPTSDGALSFVSTSGGSGGIVLDNVQFDSFAAPVPEPSDLMGTAIAFGSVVLLKRKLTKKTLG
jgi:hypothetical protein